VKKYWKPTALLSICPPIPSVVGPPPGDTIGKIVGVKVSGLVKNIGILLAMLLTSAIL
jgi:hypothetical protein